MNTNYLKNEASHRELKFLQNNSVKKTEKG